jgi:hypothetical protein
VLLPILEGVSAVLNRFILEEGGEIVQFEAKSVSYLLGDDDASLVDRVSRRDGGNQADE